jgi:hypothetical protein
MKEVTQLNERIECAKFVLDTVTNIMDFQENRAGNKIWWAHCFGSVLEYVADKTFSIDYDLDIGVLYGQCDEDKLINAFEGYGFKTQKKIINDVNKKVLNIHFIPGTDTFPGAPTIDVYFWVLIGDKYYHTYDVNKEGKKIPSEYVFKGAKKWWLTPSESVINKELSIGKPGRRQLLTKEGTWNFPVFESDSGLAVRVPFAVGHLLDEWYTPTWRFRELYRGESRSRWVKKVKSCKELI